jgi:transcriptional regulator with XRE-family HTH domain
MNVAERLKYLREKKGYTQNLLAGLAGISQSHLRRVELGQSRITVDHLQMICDALGITLKDFFDYTADQDELSNAISTLTPKQKQLLINFIKSL